jgi:DNA-binding MarR family transcriptional regulator
MRVQIPLSQAHALIELGRGPMTQRNLTAALRLERSSVSRLVDRLHEHGWVATTVDPDHGGGVLVSLTDEGRRVHRQLSSARSKRFAALLAAIPPDRRDQVVEALALLTTASATLEDPS